MALQIRKAPLTSRYWQGREVPSAKLFGGKLAPPCVVAERATWRYFLVPPGYI
jgi:hypothetical protein